MTDDAQSTSPSTAEPTTEQPTVVTAATPAAETAPPATPLPPSAETPPPVSPPVPPAAEPPPGPSTTDKLAAMLDERPELGAGGALAGGIVFALILKRLGR
ncbi:MAG TPA: hypothetical protein VFW09_06940 [Solirubrobacteraceae bacterium]|nr:hypothetical protein [Solirubrobacteraceae bacterium]